MALETVFFFFFIIGSYGLVTLSVNTHRQMQECTVKTLVKRIQDSLPTRSLSLLLCEPLDATWFCRDDRATNHRNNPVALTAPPPNSGLMLNCSFSCVSGAFFRCGGSAGGRRSTSILDLLNLVHFSSTGAVISKSFAVDLSLQVSLCSTDRYELFLSKHW